MGCRDGRRTVHLRCRGRGRTVYYPSKIAMYGKFKRILKGRFQNKYNNYCNTSTKQANLKQRSKKFVGLHSADHIPVKDIFDVEKFFSSINRSVWSLISVLGLYIEENIFDSRNATYNKHCVKMWIPYSFFQYKATPFHSLRLRLKNSQKKTAFQSTRIIYCD